MLLTQALISFVFWIGAGVWIARRPRPASKERGRTLFTATAFLFGSVLALLAGFGIGYGVGGLEPDHMTAVAWFFVTLGGIGFVACQVNAVAMILSVLAGDRIGPPPGAE